MRYLYFTRFETPLGPCIIASVRKKICWFSFNDTGSRFASFINNYVNQVTSGVLRKDFELFKSRYPTIARMMTAKNISIVDDPSKFTDILQGINDYFAGKHVDFSDVRVVYLTGTEFQHKIWDALRDIPYGEVRSYKQIGEMIDKPESSRAVGQANGKNIVPLIIPCHRVIKNDGTIGGFSGGTEIKEKLLELEGVTFKSS